MSDLQANRRQIFSYLTARGVEKTLARKACLLVHYHEKDLKAWHKLTFAELVKMGFTNQEVYLLTGEKEEEKKEEKKRKTLLMRIKKRFFVILFQNS